MKNPVFFFGIALSMLLFVSPAFSFQGKVVGISDGDTITVLHDGSKERIRLYGIDCPESRQDFGTRARQFTSEQVFGKVVNVLPMDTDRYGRTVAVVENTGQVLNRVLIEAGMAWVFEHYCTLSMCSEWRLLQNRARNQQLGVWSMTRAIPPWEFRHSR